MAVKKATNSKAKAVKEEVKVETPVEVTEEVVTEEVVEEVVEETIEEVVEETVEEPTEEPQEEKVEVTEVEIPQEPKVEEEPKVEVNKENAEVSRKENGKVKIRMRVDHKCCIAMERYDLKEGKTYTVPENVKKILNKAGLLAPL